MKKGPQDDPFILASQVEQLFYLDFVSDDKKHLEWVEDEQSMLIPIQPTLELDDDNILVVPDLYDDENQNVSDGESDDDENDNEEDDY
ncbi:hypothetical protein LIER_41223 [Lithospermum erythrorhizon]|uniref:Uncharacterized protein n=1 Tax=Lithospermum erythrorhizon TaxID=34254 RepID=A0AAV3R9Y2_LITER